ncbi:MAG TPA: sigma-70 family RNA polymerase sigma factor [Rubrobacter sp.]|nr:sigma-70 family RNA polymerase sigma factor [Rubrobacter sp.]
MQGSERDKALAELRVVLVRGLRGALTGRAGGDFDPAAIEDFAQDALVKILRNLDSFRGESRFTTWAQKIAVRVAFTELRRKQWRDVSLQDLVARYGATKVRLDTLTDPLPTPEQLISQQVLLAMLERSIAEELTDWQRQALVAVEINKVPLEEVARRMGTNRNALYKLLHDARQRLKKRMIAEGISPQDLLPVISERETL